MFVFGGCSGGFPEGPSVWDDDTADIPATISTEPHKLREKGGGRRRLVTVSVGKEGAQKSTAADADHA